MRRQVALFEWRRAGWPAGRLLVLVAAFVGLFAMHGLSDHGSMHSGPSGAHGPAAATEVHDGAVQEVRHGEHAAVAAVAAVAASAAVAMAHELAASSDALDAATHTAMGLCLAVLAGIAALALRRLRPWSFALDRATSEAVQRQLLARSRAPDPPDLHVLSVQRC